MSALTIAPKRLIELLTLALIGWYVLLILVHYTNQRPLWLDEQLVFINIKDNAPGVLFTQPLAHDQQFPRLYLFTVQWFSSHFQFSLLSLRLCSFICMLGAFGIWLLLIRRMLESAQERLAFVACWAGSIPLIYYAAELKPYSMDVFAAAFFLLFLYHQQDLQKKSAGLHRFIVCALPLLGLWSYPAFLMLIFPAWNILRMRQNSWRADLGLYALICTVVLACVYWFDLRVGNGAALKVYWEGSFISFESVGKFFSTTFEGINNLICRWFADHPKWIRAVARGFMIFALWEMAAGFKDQLKKDGGLFRSVGSIALIVFMQLYVLCALKLYAFPVPRASLFFAPMLLLLAVKGFGRLGRAGVAVRWLFIGFLLYVSSGIGGVVIQGDLGAQSPLFK